MLFYSTRDKERKAGFTASDAILKGLAPDGGLFVPEVLPPLLEGLSASLPYSEFAAKVLAPFFAGDVLSPEIPQITADAFNFPIPMKELSDGNTILELFHGPTAAFKDFGARFLACSMERLLVRQHRRLTILVATSGDTGGAVAAAFFQRRNLSVKVLFPKGRVALRQKKQLTCWGENVESYEVAGSFDDCQRMVKSAFMDGALTKGLSSANSINLGRLLPQVVYYVYASIAYREMHGVDPVIIIPSGNVGNSTGAYWAKAMGAPIARIVLAVNENHTIPDYLDSGVYQPRASVETLANAMDVGAPSNMERLFSLFPDFATFKANVTAYSVSDEKIKETIKDEYVRNGYIVCPHTATGCFVRDHFLAGEKTICVSTAHPAKFNTIVEPLIGTTVPVPEVLSALFDKESRYKDVGTDYHEIF